MSESSRSRVTITLGRTGHVVKLGEYDLDGCTSVVHPVAVKKRSVRERLGEYVDSADQFSHKRFCGVPRNVYAADEDVHLSKHDLRHKIMQKNRLKQRHSQQRDDDLRNILSRPPQYSKGSMGMGDMVRGSKSTGIEYFEDYKDQSSDIMDGCRFPPINRHSSESLVHDSREHIVEAREDRHGFLEVKEFRYRTPEFFDPNMISDTPGMRASDDILQRESMNNSYSPWNLDQLRKKSPDQISVSPKIDGTQRRCLPSYNGTNSSREKYSFEVAPKRDENMQRRCPMNYTSTNMKRNKDAFEVSKSKSLPYAANVAPLIGKRASLVPLLPPQRKFEPIDAEDPVISFLRPLGLERLAVIFKAEEVDMYSLKRMSESDLAELEIPVGPRKQILYALRSLR